MLFWITWITGNLVYVKTYHTMITRDYLSLPSIDIQGHVNPKARFYRPKISLNSTKILSFDWGNLNHFRLKVPKIVQIWLKPYLLTGTIQTILDQKNSVKTVHITIKLASPKIKVPNLNKMKEIWSFHHVFRIFE